MKDSLIQNAPLLSSLSPDEQQQIASAMTEMTFGKGETLTAQGQPTNRMYLVQKRLRVTRPFSDLTDEQLSAIAEKLEPMEIRRGGLIFRAGAPADALFIIEEGEVLLTSAAEESGEPFRALGAGDVMGEMS